MLLVDPPVYDNRVQHAFYPEELQQSFYLSNSSSII
jgi:hypothetical protein